MKLQDCLVRAWQKAPLPLRRALVSSFLASSARRWMNKAYTAEPQIFPLAPPLEGMRMRLHWQTSKAYVFGTHEPQVVQALVDKVRPGWVAMDLGAHIGYFTLLLAKLVGPQGRVIAFEPLPDNFATLEENVRVNRCTNVALENLAVGACSGQSTLHRNDADPLTSTASLQIGQPIGAVEVVSLDDYSKLHPGRIHFVMMDVEHAEAAVLQGMREVLRRDRPILLIELHSYLQWQERHLALVQIREMGYAVRYLEPPGGQAHILAESASAGALGS